MINPQEHPTPRLHLLDQRKFKQIVINPQNSKLYLKIKIQPMTYIKIT